MIHRVLLSIFLFSAIAASGQSVAEGRYIEVQGSSTVKVAPDVAYISIVVDQSDVATKGDIAKTEAKIYSVLRQLDIDADSMLRVISQTSSYIGRKQSGLRKSYRLELRDISLVGGLFDALSEIGVSNSRVESLDVRDRQAHALEARSRAVADARLKAEALAQAADIQINGVTLIVDNTRDGAANYLYATRSVMAKSSDAIAESIPEIEFKDVEFSATITMRFSIE